MIQKFTEIYQNLLEQHRVKCLCYFETENYILAIESFKKLRNLGQFNNEDLYLYTRCHIAIGLSDVAKEIIPFIDTPETPNDFLNISQFYFLVGDNNNSIEVINKGFEKFPDNRFIMELFIKLVIQYNIPPLDSLVRSNFQKCLRQYSESKFENKIVHSFDFSEDIGPNELVQELNKIVGSDNIVDQFLPQKQFEEIQNKKLPISYIKGINNKNFIYIWYESLANPSVIFWTAYGNEKDDIERAAISQGDIYIDLSSLLILFKLNLLRYLPEYFKKVFITQSIFDEISNVLLDKKNIMINTTFLDLTEKEQTTYKQYSSNFYKEVWGNAEQLIDLITSNSDFFVIVGAPIHKKNKDAELLRDISINDHIRFDIECLQYSYAQGISVFYDNLTLRHLYNELDNSPKAFGIVTFIQALLEKRILKENYYSIISKLIKYKYSSFQIDKNLLIHNMVSEGYCINSNTKSVFQLLGNSQYNISIIKRVIEVLAFLWFHPMSMDVKEKWTFFIEEVITLRKEIDHYGFVLLLYKLSRYIPNNQSRISLDHVINELIKKYHITMK